MAFHVPEKFRVHLQGLPIVKDCNNGAFICKLKHGQSLKVIASEGMGWEHVSVSRTDRSPTWEEMCQVKDMFWDKDDCVVQYHPSESEYVNNHPFCLHLWRPMSGWIRIPPSALVGYAGMSAKDAKRMAKGMK